jgi:hypothetical protein
MKITVIMIFKSLEKLFLFHLAAIEKLYLKKVKKIIVLNLIFLQKMFTDFSKNYKAI